jgi:NADPH:quinone reductase-like Zn-dependent oxidoreductase
MKAVVMREFGAPGVLRPQDVADPEPAPGEVLVRVAAVSVNNLDLRLRTGDYHRRPALPHVLGWDPSGTVVMAGRDAGGVTEGQRVVFKGRIRCGRCAACADGRPRSCERSQQLGLDRWGAYAEYISVPEANLRPVPPNLSFAEATVIFRHFPQALTLLEETAGLQAGEWLLVMGAAGALGSCLCQVGKLLGARVIAGAGTDERAAGCLANGADFAVNYRARDLAAEVMSITDGHGVDVLTENIGDPAIWPGAFSSLARRGRLVTVGAHGGGVVQLDLNQLYLKHIKIVGTAGSRPGDTARAAQLAAAGQIRAVIGATLPLEDAAQAHRLAEARGVIGKIVLVSPPV